MRLTPPDDDRRTDQPGVVAGASTGEEVKTSNEVLTSSRSARCRVRGAGGESDQFTLRTIGIVALGLAGLHDQLKPVRAIAICNGSDRYWS